MSIHVSKAETEEQRQAVYRFRYRIYVEELEWEPPSVDHENRLLRDALDPLAQSYLLESDGEPVGTLRLLYLSRLADAGKLREKYALGPVLNSFQPDEVMFSSRFMLHPRLRHGKAILSLVGKAYEDARRDGIRLNFADCSPHLLPLYEHLGYRRYANPFEDPGFGFKLPLMMLMGDAEGLEAGHSPLARLARKFPVDDMVADWYQANYTHYAELPSAQRLPDGMFLELLAERVGRDPVHHLSLLSGLSREEAGRFLAEATIIKARPDDRIVRQGERDDTLYVIMDGMAEVFLDDGPDQPINLMSQGDTFGEVGLLGRLPRTANVIARSPCELLVLSADFFRRFLRREPAIAAKVSLNLAQSLALRLALATPGQMPCSPSSDGEL